MFSKYVHSSFGQVTNVRNFPYRKDARLDVRIDTSTSTLTSEGTKPSLLLAMHILFKECQSPLRECLDVLLRSLDRQIPNLLFGRNFTSLCMVKEHNKNRTNPQPERQGFRPGAIPITSPILFLNHLFIPLQI